MRTLVAGYGLGEFGWILMKWVPFVRHLASNYDKVICGIENGHEYLYADFADEFFVFSEKIKTRNMLMVNQKTYPLKLDVKNADFVHPHRGLNKIKGAFIPYGTTPYKKYHFDIIIHARNTFNLNTQYRNWSKNNWLKLVNKFSGHRFACIGATLESYHIPGTIDLRGINLESVTKIMRGSGVFVGPSSGPAHLASLCELPQVVWGGEKQEVIGCTNEQRYKKDWNPFGVNVSYIKEWQPSVETVEKQLKGYL